MKNKHKKIFQKIILTTKQYIQYFYYTIFFIIFYLCKVKQNKIIVINYRGKGYGDSAKCIIEELTNNNDKYIIYWATKKNVEKSLPSFINHVRFNTPMYLYHLFTSKIIINNSRFSYGIRKKNKQYYIQTWHSSLRIKQIEKDAEKHLSKQYIKAAKNDSKLIDLMISGCSFSTKIYKESFWYDGEVLECGTPRCDVFFNNEYKKEIKKKIYETYNIPKSKKIILYAPTFRRNSNTKENEINYENVIKKINVNNDYIFFVRFHPNSHNTINNSENVINVTSYPDMQELICISNILITDYSGCCFDMMINNGKCLLYVPDYKDYLKNERGTYFKLDDLPFPKIKSEKELINTINNFDEEKYKKEINDFRKKINLYEDGNASKKIANRIKEVINNEKI